MASRQATLDFVLEQIAGAGVVSAKKMFGEYGLFCDGRMIGTICDDRLFIKPTAAGRGFAGACAEASPYPGAKPCFVIDDDRIDDRAWLSRLVRLTASELPLPKKKTPKRPAGKE